ncbi:hypothetical protein ACOJBM_02195 [Rhizobium beringeri]
MTRFAASSAAALSADCLLMAMLAWMIAATSAIVATTPSTLTIQLVDNIRSIPLFALRILDKGNLARIVGHDLRRAAFCFGRVDKALVAKLNGGMAAPIAWFQICDPDNRAVVFWSSAPCNKPAVPIVACCFPSVLLLALMAEETAASALTTCPTFLVFRAVAPCPTVSRIDRSLLPIELPDNGDPETALPFTCCMPPRSFFVATLFVMPRDGATVAWRKVRARCMQTAVFCSFDGPRHIVDRHLSQRRKSKTSG